MPKGLPNREDDRGPLSQPSPSLTLSASVVKERVFSVSARRELQDVVNKGPVNVYRPTLAGQDCGLGGVGHDLRQAARVEADAGGDPSVAYPCKAELGVGPFGDHGGDC